MAKRAQLDEVRPIFNEVNAGVSKVEGVLDAVEHGTDRATEALEHGLEKVADVIPEALDKSVHVVAEGTRKGVRAFQNPRVLILSLMVGGGLAGAAFGIVAYRIQKKRIEKELRVEFEQRLEQEIAAMQKFFEKRSTKKQPFASPEEAAEKLLPKTREEVLAEEAAAALNEYEGSEPPPGIISSENDPREGTNHRTRYDRVEVKRGKDVPVSVERVEAQNSVTEAEAEEIRHNVFVHSAKIDGWDQEREEAGRHPESPYVISHDEYMENSYEHEQHAITYYKGDDTLVDEREVPIEEVEAVVGIENLQLFGHGSRDSNVVYIRNERSESDFEITLNQGTYTEEVVGFSHSDLPNSRFRHGRRDDGG